MCSSDSDVGNMMFEDELNEAILREFIEETLAEIVRKCGHKWCLYSKHKKGGKRKRLGTHPSKAAAYRQERAIKMHGG
jgi:hypothetical protein